MPLTVNQHLAIAAYRKGFHDGADPMRARKRRVSDPSTHRHYQAGFHDGSKAADQAYADYKRFLEVSDGRS